jgi:hypothetical protein
MPRKKINKFDLPPQICRLKRNLNATCNQKTTIPVIDESHEDAIPSGTPLGLNIDRMTSQMKSGFRM